MVQLAVWNVGQVSIQSDAGANVTVCADVMEQLLEMLNHPIVLDVSKENIFLRMAIPYPVLVLIVQMDSIQMKLVLNLSLLLEII